MPQINKISDLKKKKPDNNRKLNLEKQRH